MKRTRTNTAKQLDVAIKVLLIKNINLDYINISDNATIKQRIAGAYMSFKNEAGYNIDRIGEQGAIVEWLRGLPGAIYVIFTNDSILKYADSIGLIDIDTACDAEIDMIIDQWFPMLGIKLGQLFRGYSVPKIEGLK